MIDDYPFTRKKSPGELMAEGLIREQENDSDQPLEDHMIDLREIHAKFIEHIPNEE